MSTQAPWVVVDVETSGFTPADSRVISVAALVVDDDANIQDSVVTLLNPGVDPGPTNVHGITPDMLAGQPQFDDISGTLAALMQGRTLVAHNATFDYGFLRNEFQLAGIDCPVEQVMCTVELSAKLNLGIENHRLATVARYWNVQQLRPHDAFDDAFVLTQILANSLKLARGSEFSLPIRHPSTLAPSTFRSRPAA